jgi:ribosomal protein L7/L12
MESARFSMVNIGLWFTAIGKCVSSVEKVFSGAVFGNKKARHQKIQVIKEVRAITHLGLGEAKALVDAAPSTILEGAKKDAANDAKSKLEAAGGKVTLK